MRTSLPALAVLALSLPVVSQGTGRTMRLLAPAVIGQTASFGMTYPVAAAGNLYSFLWCCPPFPGTATLTVPGFTLLGAIRVDPQLTASAFSGLLGSSGTVTHSVAVPGSAAFAGYAWDLQSVDLEAGASRVWFAENELTLVISDAVLTSMVLIAPGTFPMGSNAGPPDNVPPYFAHPYERPVHQVTISRPFWIGRHEVTQAEYQALVGNNPSYHQGAGWPNAANHPVEQVTWIDATAYCVLLTAQQAAAGRLPSAYQYRLPTEAEWEYCCRAGTTTEFHYGSALQCGQARISYSYHPNTSCSVPTTTVVGSYLPNAWGLYDMHGNVFEWCLDCWDGITGYPATLQVDPCVATGSRMVIRGGSCATQSNACRSAHRVQTGPSNRYFNLGFRVVLGPILP